MSPRPILGAVTTLSVTDPDGCDRAALADLAGLVRQVRGWLRRRRSHHRHLRDRLSVPEVLTPGGRHATCESSPPRRSCDELPVLHDALASGDGGGRACRRDRPVVARVDEPVRAALVADAESLVATAVDLDGGCVRTSRRRSRPPPGGRRARRRRPAAGAAVAAPLDRPGDRDVPHPPHPRPGSRRRARPPSGCGDRRRTRQARHDRSFDQLRADAFVSFVTSRTGCGVLGAGECAHRPRHPPPRPPRPLGV